MSNRSAIVIGAGIVGLATARALAQKGFKVKVLERTHTAVGASVRNFGMVWPIGQPAGELYNRAIRSREVWKLICEHTGSWYSTAGSLHVAHSRQEWEVLQELYEIYGQQRPWSLLNADDIASHSNEVETRSLLGALFSADELVINPRTMIAILPAYLHEKYGVEFLWGKCVSYVSQQVAHVGQAEQHKADLVFICSGADFETLYPEAFSAAPLTKCKLQMMRFSAGTPDMRIGPALCGGLSLIHYNSFKAATSLTQLKKMYEEEMPDYLKWGIHVMVSQNHEGELTVGDSHEYGLTHQPFDTQTINRLIIDYLRKFAKSESWQLSESWNGIYAKMTNGESHLYFSPAPGVYVVNALGGAGMTLSFGLAEDLVSAL